MMLLAEKHTAAAMTQNRFLIGSSAVSRHRETHTASAAGMATFTISDFPSYERVYRKIPGMYIVEESIFRTDTKTTNRSARLRLYDPGRFEMSRTFFPLSS